jgi:hypothetical protein
MKESVRWKMHRSSEIVLTGKIGVPGLKNGKSKQHWYWINEHKYIMIADKTYFNWAWMMENIWKNQANVGDI